MRQRLRDNARRAAVVLALAFGAAVLVTVVSWLFAATEAAAESTAGPPPLDDVVGDLSAAVADPIERPLRTVSQAERPLHRVSQAVPRVATAAVEPVRATVRDGLPAVGEPVGTVSALVARADLVPASGSGGVQAAHSGVDQAAPKPPPAARPQAMPHPVPRHDPVAVTPGAPAPPAQHDAGEPTAPDVPVPAPVAQHTPAPAAPASPGGSTAGHPTDLGTVGGRILPSPPVDGLPGGRLPAASTMAHPVHAQPGVTPD